ncbi:unnamed protein product [Urochloa humidicola]
MQMEEQFWTLTFLSSLPGDLFSFFCCDGNNCGGTWMLIHLEVLQQLYSILFSLAAVVDHLFLHACGALCKHTVGEIIFLPYILV